MLQDARVLQEDYVPEAVEARNAELNELSRALDPVEENEQAENVLLFGPSGTGKTFLAKFMVEELNEELPGVHTQYVDCWRNYSRFDCLYEVLDGIASTIDIHRESTPTGEILNRIEEYEGPPNGRPYVVILDEADQLEGKKVLYDLYNVNGLSMILIANEREEFFTSLGQRLLSRLRTCRQIELGSYSLSALVEILDSRAELALGPEAVDRRQLETIADIAAGDARQAIAILRTAARQADRKRSEITDEIIKEVVPEAIKDLQRKRVGMLKDHQRVLYEILQEHGELEPGELYGRYSERVDEPRSDRTVRNYLNKLEHYDLVVGEGEKRGRTYKSK
jgi:Cdc6-like AAA superfamily ATPase